MRVILFLLFIYLVIKLVWMMLVMNRVGSNASSRSYTFRGSSNPFGNVRQPNSSNGNVKKKRNLDNLADAEFEEIEDDK
ncbi:MAG: hypothetical protein WD491_01835 [Balneolales bacterium]